MSNYNSLKTTIDANIKQNGRQEITGQILNSVLNQMVTTLGAGYQFAGVATLDPATDPGTPDAKVFYIANGKGTYNNFGGVEVTEDEVVVLYWDSSWHKVSTGIASQEKLTELESEVIYDVTANNSGATFASLSALLSSENLSTLIPSEVRCGGMSIRFVQSSDNTYVQYMNMNNVWSTNVNNWQKINIETQANPFVFCDNTKINQFVKELYLKNSTSFNAAHNFSINIYNNYVDSDNKYVSGILFVDETTSQQFEILNVSNEQNVNSLISKENGDCAVFNFSIIPQGERIFITGLKINKEFVTDINFSPTIKNYYLENKVDDNQLQLSYISKDERTFVPNYEEGDLNDHGEEIPGSNYYRTGYIKSADLEYLKYNKISAVLLYVFTYDENKNLIKITNVGNSGYVFCASIGFYTRFVWRKTDVFKLTLPLDGSLKEIVTFSRGNSGQNVDYNDSIDYRLISTRIDYRKDKEYHITPLTSNVRYYIGFYKGGILLGELDWCSVGSKNKVFNPYKDTEFFIVACGYTDTSTINEGDELLSVECKEKSDISYSYGNYNSGWQPDRIDRLHSEMLRFPYPVFVNVKKTEHVNTSSDYWNREYNRFQILLFDDSWNFVRTTTQDWTTYEQYIPENTNFIVLMSKENNVSLSSKFDIINDLIGVSTEKNYSLLPRYYFDNNYINNKITFIREKMNTCASNGDTFFLITDIHWDRNEKHSPALINYISKNIPIQRMFNCGDDFDGTSLNVFNIFKEAFNLEYYWTTGNHDTIPNAPQNSPNCIVSTHLQNIDKAKIGDMNNRYYYVDNQQQKIRYIMLNSLNEKLEDNTPIYHYAFDDEQMNWLEDVALNVESGWTILIFTHIVFFMDGSDSDTWILPPSGIIPTENFRRFLSIVNNYQGNGEIAAIFQGDEHEDRIIRLSADNIPSGITPSNIPVIATACDCYTGFIPGIAPNGLRNSGTIDEQLFDVVVLDKTQRKITLVRIGAKAMNGVGMSANDKGVAAEYREVTY